MKIGILSDAHGNAVGLNLCFQFFIKQDVKKIFFLGDAVGYLPEANNVISLLDEMQAHCLLGNHDAMLVGHLELDTKKDQAYKIGEARRKIVKKNIEKISSRLPYFQTEIDGCRILLVHGSPWEPLIGCVYVDNNLHDFSCLPFEYVFLGHTHRPFIKKIGHITVINVGSCGLPRDQGNLASCVIFDTLRKSVNIFCIKFDSESLVNHYENQIHDSVINCLLRKSRSKIIGHVVEDDLYE